MILNQLPPVKGQNVQVAFLEEMLLFRDTSHYVLKYKSDKATDLGFSPILLTKSKFIQIRKFLTHNLYDSSVVTFDHVITPLHFCSTIY